MPNTRLVTVEYEVLESSLATAWVIDKINGIAITPPNVDCAAVDAALARFWDGRAKEDPAVAAIIKRVVASGGQDERAALQVIDQQMTKQPAVQIAA